jgi:hypothetical protein
MDLKKLTKTQVKRAFSLVGSLATSVTFIKDEPSTFDFLSQTADVPTKPETTVLKGIPVDATTKPRDKVPQNVEQRKLMFLTETLVPLELHSTATFEGKTWKLTAPFSGDEFITTITFVREYNG